MNKKQIININELVEKLGLNLNDQIFLNYKEIKNPEGIIFLFYLLKQDLDKIKKMWMDAFILNEGLKKIKNANINKNNESNKKTKRRN